MSVTKKTTIELDEQKLARVMKLTGIKTRRAAVDFALEQAERVGKMMEIFEGEFFVEAKGEVVAQDYDPLKLRLTEV